MTTRRLVTGVLALVVVVGVSGAAHAQRERGRPEVRGVVKAVDVGGKSITVSVGGPRDNPNVAEKVFPVSGDVEVAIGGGFGRGIVLQESKLADLAPGTPIGLTLSADEKTVESIRAEEPALRGVVQKIDAAAKTLSIQTRPEGRGEPGETTTVTLADDAEIAIDDGRGRRYSTREATLGEVAAGAFVTVTLTLDRQKARSLLAEGPSVQGTVKSIDGATRTLTLTLRPARGDDAGEERTLVVAPEATVVLDDGRGRLLSQKAGKLTDVPAGSAMTVRLSPDQGRVMHVRVEGPTVQGQLKSADAEKGTITITIRRNRGEEPEEKTIALAKDARVFSEGLAVPLGSLKPVENGPFVMIRLSLDQTKAQMVTAEVPRGR